MGAPIMRAPIVTRKDETIMGKMPKEPFVGAHLKPPIILLNPTFRKRGRPSARIKMKIRKEKEEGREREGYQYPLDESFFQDGLFNHRSLQVLPFSRFFARLLKG